MTSIPHPLLVGDIGGTNARFALVPEPGAAPIPVAHLRTADHEEAEEALEAAIARSPAPPAGMALCVAAFIMGRAARMTNAGWTFDGPALARRFGLGQGLLLNDFEAAALSLAVLRGEDVTPIGAPVAVGRGPRVILGPGTGLGVAALVEAGGCTLAVPGEAGHVGFGPEGPAEATFWPHLERVAGRITPEVLLSGPGLVRLHRAMAAAEGREAPEADPREIAEQARGRACAHCVGTVRAFLDLLARFSGDMGIAFGATGGVYLRGGVIASLAPLLDGPRFRERFEAKEPVAAFARAIPAFLLTSEEAVLRGLAAVGAAPARFGLDDPDRLWVTPPAGPRTG
ncbi:MAG TPA: glucokinase [Salinarimonas sp.]|nr:glucokinase [Salinarimonas sp.]